MTLLLMGLMAKEISKASAWSIDCPIFNTKTKMTRIQLFALGLAAALLLPACQQELPVQEDPTSEPSNVVPVDADLTVGFDEGDEFRALFGTDSEGKVHKDKNTANGYVAPFEEPTLPALVYLLHEGGYEGITQILLKKDEHGKYKFKGRLYLNAGVNDMSLPGGTYKVYIALGGRLGPTEPERFMGTDMILQTNDVPHPHASGSLQAAQSTGNSFGFRFSTKERSASMNSLKIEGAVYTAYTTGTMTPTRGWNPPPPGKESDKTKKYPSAGDLKMNPVVFKPRVQLLQLRFVNKTDSNIDITGLTMQTGFVVNNVVFPLNKEGALRAEAEATGTYSPDTRFSATRLVNLKGNVPLREVYYGSCLAGVRPEGYISVMECAPIAFRTATADAKSYLPKALAPEATSEYIYAPIYPIGKYAEDNPTYWDRSTLATTPTPTTQRRSTKFTVNCTSGGVTKAVKVRLNNLSGAEIFNHNYRDQIVRVTLTLENP